MSILLDTPLPDLAAAVASGQLSAAEVHQAATSAHRRYGQLEAYQHWCEQTLLAQRYEPANAPALAGVPVSVKDLYGVAGLPTWAGTSARLPPAWQRPGPLINRLLDSGATITGKTRMVELAFGGLGTNPHWPIPRNPWDAQQSRVCGGSSSGAGLSLLEGSACLALASDTAGSARIPASMTGTLGLKITQGRWSTAGMVPLSSTLDTPGLLARTALDLAYGFTMLDAADNQSAMVTWQKLRDTVDESAPSNYRLGVLDGALTADCDAGVLETVETMLAEIAGWGAAVEKTDWPEVPAMLEFLATGGVTSAECCAFIEGELPQLWRQLDPMVAARIADGGDITAREYLLRARQLNVFSTSAKTLFAKVDLLVTPTVPITPPRVADITELADYRRANMLALRNTCLANLAGLCALTIPAGLDAQGLPTGLQLMAPAGAEQRLLTFAMALEHHLGTPRERLGEALLVL